MSTGEALSTEFTIDASPVCCAHCGEEFFYDMKAQAGQHLEEADDVVPCPCCGAFHPEMVAIIKREYLGWMRTIGFGSMITAPLMFVVAIFARFHQQDLLASSVICGCVGLALVSIRAFLAFRYDPNRGDFEQRKLLGRSRAFAAEDNIEVGVTADLQVVP
jgi:hypothetical protein